MKKIPLKCNGKTFSIGDHTIGCADAGRNTKTNKCFHERAHHRRVDAGRTTKVAHAFMEKIKGSVLI
jgi:hypothetical protein